MKTLLRNRGLLLSELTKILFVCFVFSATSTASAQIENSNENAAGQVAAQANMRIGYLIQVPLPITETVAVQIKQQIQRIAGEAPITQAAKSAIRT